MMHYSEVTINNNPHEDSNQPCLTTGKSRGSGGD